MFNHVAIVGVGNCASSLIQGVEYYRNADPTDRVPGLMHVTFGDYHVNDRYPVKLVADAVAGVTVDGTGAWKLDGEKSGTLTVKFRADKAGPAKLTGTFKLSVCTDENCEIDAPAIAFDVTAG